MRPKVGILAYLHGGSMPIFRRKVGSRFDRDCCDCSTSAGSIAILASLTETAVIVAYLLLVIGTPIFPSQF